MWNKGKNKEKSLLDQKYVLRRKEFTVVMEELKQKKTVKAIRVKQYDNRTNNFNKTETSWSTKEQFSQILKAKRRPPNAEV